MKYGLAVLALLITSQVSAQLLVGNQRMAIMPTTPVNIDGLTLAPATDLVLIDNSIQRSTTPIPGTPNSSISRVYQLASPISFSGSAGIYYLGAELNGNSEPNLQLAYRSGPGSSYVVTTGSTVDLAARYVSNTVTNQNLLLVTATTQTSALPVTFINFLVHNTNQTAVLNWMTSLEHNVDHFEIQASPDLERWQTIGQLQAKGESTSTTTYQFVHTDVTPGVNYYRLKVVDKDASYMYSPSRSILIDGSAQLVLFPNPVSDRLQLKGGLVKAIQRIEIYDKSGRSLKMTSLLPPGGLDVTNLPAGHYILRIRRQDGSLSSHSFVKE